MRSLLQVEFIFRNKEDAIMAVKPKSIRLSLNTKDQKIEALNDLLAKVGGLAGCGRCGRIAFLHIDLLGDPPPDFARDGVISMQIEG